MTVARTQLNGSSADTGSALRPELDEAAFYRELTTRNRGVVDAAAQERLRTAVVLVAGCGSIGGATVEPLARLGVQNFLLADPGEYEVNNLNRQNATLDDVDRNKAEVAADRVRSINPFAQVRVFGQGVDRDVVEELTSACDVVVDGVDVTTMAGLRAKYLLHEHAAARRLPLFTGWDMAGAQYVRYYDYRTIREPFGGQITAADLDRLGMWELLKRLVPLRFIPLEMFTIARANLDDPDFTFPQMVYAADLFGALGAHVVTQLLTGGPVREHTYVDVHQAVRPTAGRWATTLRRPLEGARAVARLRRTRTTD